MDAENLVTALVRIQLVASVAIVLVLLLRRLVLRRYGAAIAYWLWLVVPIAAMAALLPAREQVVAIPAVLDIPVLQKHMEPAGVTRERLAAAPEVQSRVPDARLRSGLLIALWLLGAGVFLVRSIVNTRRLAASSLIGPALVGVFRPKLVLPQDFEARFDARERELILAHEEIHRVSRHTMVNALVEVARCASWFNPLVHLAAGRFRADQELACDTAVIAAHPEARHTYAEALLKAQVAGAYLPMGCVWTSDTAGRLGERIALLSEQLPGRRRRLVGAASVVFAGIAAGFAAWAQQPVKIITVQQPSLESAAPALPPQIVPVTPSPPVAVEAPHRPLTGGVVAKSGKATRSVSQGESNMNKPASLAVVVAAMTATANTPAAAPPPAAGSGGQTSAEQILASNDLNKDGVVTKEEATAAGKTMIKMWNLYDMDSDGKVTLAEATTATSAMLTATAEEKITGEKSSGPAMAKPQSIIEANDLDKDGIVTKEEAMKVGKGLARLWANYDINRDGKVDAAEVARAQGY